VRRSIHEGALDMARQIARSWEGRIARRLRKKVEILHIEKMKVNQNGGPCNGVSFAPNGPAKLFISDSDITNNGISTPCQRAAPARLKRSAARTCRRDGSSAT
jgi:hypothetical protein